MYSRRLSLVLAEKATTLEVAYPDHTDSDDHLKDRLERLIHGYNQKLNPSHLLFLCPEGIGSKIGEIFDANKRQYMPMLRTLSDAVVVSYDEAGKLSNSDPLEIIKTSNAGTHWLTDDKLAEISRTVASGIVDRTKTIMRAPHGYVFKKPSGNTENIFIRAGNMLREPHCLPVFNYLLLRKLPANCRTLYIDSFTILSFALGLQSLVRHFQREPHSRTRPEIIIEHFHSYEMEPGLSIPNDPNYFILISASTSGGLANKLVAEKQANRNNIAHLLAVGDREGDEKLRLSSILFRESSPAKPPDGSRSSLIHISTEEFLVNHGKPNLVQVTKHHINSKAAEELRKRFYLQKLRFNFVEERGRPHSFFSVSQKITDRQLDDAPIRPWLDGQLLHELPSSIDELIPTDDPASERLALRPQHNLKKPRGKSVRLTALSEIEKLGFQIGRSAAIVSYFDPGLESFLRASGVLRNLEKPSPYRHYVLGYAFPPTYAEYERLKKDLLMSSSRPRWGWSEFLALPVGEDLLHQSLALRRIDFTDASIAERRPVLGQNLADALLKRNNRTRVSGKDLFLPNSAGEPLKLGEGSVFFSGKYSSNLSQIAVHAMVSSSMQAAREPLLARVHESLPKFDDNPFVRSVLNPLMFARFSDGILQASLLRAAMPSELDYAADKNLSRQFASIFSDVLFNHEFIAGGAALEFIFALTKNKISLVREDHQRLLRVIKEAPPLRAFHEVFDEHRPF